LISEVEGAHIGATYKCTVSIKVPVSLVSQMERIFRHSVVVQRISTRWLKITYVNTHGSSFIPRKSDEACHALTSDFPLWILLHPSCSCFFEMTL
jgi:hypothetical protein